jgi:hypothetical protein
MTRLRLRIKIIEPILLSVALIFSVNFVHAAEVKENTFDVLSFTPEISAYNTELFNLLLNRNNVIDGKNRFNKKFSYLFDALLVEGHAVSDSKSLNFLKKRLLSGPEPKPLYFSASRKKYIYYEACQAHACDETRLFLLYDVELRSMRAKLVVDGVARFLGGPSQQEITLLEQLKSAQ